MQQEQHDEAGFTEPVRCETGGAVAVDGGGQGKQLEAQSQLRDVGLPASLRLIHQGMVLGFDHPMKEA